MPSEESFSSQTFLRIMKGVILMTESQIKKVENLKKEIRKVEEKIDKLLTHRAILADQIEKIKTQEPKVPSKPSEEQRKAQSEKDKAAYQESLKTHSTSIQKLNLFE